MSARHFLANIRHPWIRAMFAGWFAVAFWASTAVGGVVALVVWASQ